ncbi:MAG: serine hydrolase domain-containing protein [Burkholderiales bacterium]
MALVSLSRAGTTCRCHFFGLRSIAASAAECHYPGASWELASGAEQAGWSREKLKLAREHSASLNTDALMLIVDGKILMEWGETAARYNIHSIRKSFLSALYGVYVKEGVIDLGASMGKLGIDDNEPLLTPIEKTATVADLLKARSGIYHAALYETDGMARGRPARGSHAPGTHWYYNNWDFNALGTIFEQQTGTKIFAEFKARIADPIGMQDYRIQDGRYVTGRDSIHAAYPFRMSARDLARFGLLYLCEGAWEGRQVVPREWITESTTSYSTNRQTGGYGYLWWIVTSTFLPSHLAPAGSFLASGAHGHKILVVPALDLVLVHRVDTDVRGRNVTLRQFGQLAQMILEARVR